MNLYLRSVTRVLAALWLSLALGFALAFGVNNLPSVSAAPDAIVWPRLTLTPFITGASNPVFVTHANDNSGRLFVVERLGTIRIFKNGQLLSTPFLSITNLVQSGYVEQGLLGLAFPPNYASKKYFYVYYTDKNGVGDTVVARYFVSASPDVADSVHARIVLTQTQPQVNHNGGDIIFGPNDGYLYIGLGDGGGADDNDTGHNPPYGNGQTPSTLLGKLLRIDVEAQPVTTYTDAFTYSVPATNPYTRTAGFRPEIWALGLRNPWRYSFDRANGDLYIGDVGQNCWEEVDYQPGQNAGGQNYGWRLAEGDHVFDPNNDTNCSQPISSLITATYPITEYNHSFGCAVVGGYVYRGVRYYRMYGTYFFSDNCSNRIWGMRYSGGVWQSTQLATASGAGVSSFGEDQAGNLYAVGLANGTIYMLQGDGFNFLPSLLRDAP